MPMRLGIQSIADELWAVVYRDQFRQTFEPRNPVENTAYPLAIDRGIDFKTEIISAVAVQYVKHPKTTTVIQIVAHEIHCPAVVPPLWRWRSSTAL